MERISTCIADHHKVFRGLFTKRREKRWWKKHNICQVWMRDVRKSPRGNSQ